MLPMPKQLTRLQDWVPALRKGLLYLPGLLLFVTPAKSLRSAPKEISFSAPDEVVNAYEFVEVTLKVSGPDAKNPFTDVVIDGQFGPSQQNNQLSVDGFCDSADGSVFRIRFMPSSAGDYSYRI